MSKMIQIRNVPDELHRTLKARAALAGKSLSDYILEELTRHAEYPSLEEFMAGVKNRNGELVPSPADIIRKDRDSR